MTSGAPQVGPRHMTQCPRHMTRILPFTKHSPNVHFSARTSSSSTNAQPEVPHRMTRGGSCWSRTLSNSVLPSVSSAWRVSSGRRRGSLDLAVALISINTCATWSPQVISHSHPPASTPGRACLPRFALISHVT